MKSIPRNKRTDSWTRTISFVLVFYFLYLGLSSTMRPSCVFAAEPPNYVIDWNNPAAVDAWNADNPTNPYYESAPVPVADTFIFNPIVDSAWDASGYDIYSYDLPVAEPPNYVVNWNDPVATAAWNANNPDNIYIPEPTVDFYDVTVIANDWLNQPFIDVGYIADPIVDLTSGRTIDIIKPIEAKITKLEGKIGVSNEIWAAERDRNGDDSSWKSAAFWKGAFLVNRDDSIQKTGKQLEEQVQGLYRQKFKLLSDSKLKDMDDDSFSIGAPPDQGFASASAARRRALKAELNGRDPLGGKVEELRGEYELYVRGTNDFLKSPSSEVITEYGSAYEADRKNQQNRAKVSLNSDRAKLESGILEAEALLTQSSNKLSDWEKAEYSSTIAGIEQGISGIAEHEGLTYEKANILFNEFTRVDGGYGEQRLDEFLEPVKSVVRGTKDVTGTAVDLVGLPIAYGDILITGQDHLGASEWGSNIFSLGYESGWGKDPESLNNKVFDVGVSGDVFSAGVVVTGGTTPVRISDHAWVYRIGGRTVGTAATTYAAIRGEIPQVNQSIREESQQGYSKGYLK